MSSAAEVAAYRARVQPKLPGDYSGGKHLGSLLLASSIGALLPLAFVTWEAKSALLMFPTALVYGNFMEYAFHRFGGHAREPYTAPARAFRKYHSQVHHTFFSGALWTVGSPRDLYFVLFPAWVYLAWLVVSSVPVVLASTTGLLGGLLSRDACLLALSAGSVTLLQYEALHAFHHDGLPETLQRVLMEMPAFRGMQRRHRRHHARPGTNFSIMWPLADLVFGTLDDDGGAGGDMWMKGDAKKRQ